MNKRKIRIEAPLVTVSNHHPIIAISPTSTNQPPSPPLLVIQSEVCDVGDYGRKEMNLLKKR